MYVFFIYIKNYIVKMAFKVIGDITMRDGIQGLNKILSLQQKISIINRLSHCNYNYIEVGSIVGKKVATMADSAEVYKQIHKNNNVRYGLLAIGEKNIMKTIEIKPNTLALVTSVSSAFSHKNMGVSMEESLVQTNKFVGIAKNSGIENVRVYLSCCSICPISRYDMSKDVGKFVKHLSEKYIDELMISDTSGTMTRKMLNEIMVGLHADALFPRNKIGLHLHEGVETRKVLELATKYNIKIIDTSFAKLGGCVVIENAHNNLHINRIREYGNNLNMKLIDRCDKELTKYLFNKN